MNESKTSSGAVWSLVLGILSLLCLGPVTGIPAVICGHKARGTIRRSSGAVTGSVMAMAGLVLGYIGTLVITLTILGWILAFCVFSCRLQSRFDDRISEEKGYATRLQIASICAAIDMYEVDVGKYPQSLDDLVRNGGSPTWRGPYLTSRGSVADAWGRSLTYSMSDDSYRVSSAGQDGIVGTSDDISN